MHVHSLGCLHLLPKANKGNAQTKAVYSGVYTEFLASQPLFQPSWQALELMAAVCTLPVCSDVGAEVKLPACF